MKNKVVYYNKGYIKGIIVRIIMCYKSKSLRREVKDNKKRKDKRLTILRQ
jgi:hypothetical protein